MRKLLLVASALLAVGEDAFCQPLIWSASGKLPYPIFNGAAAVGNGYVYVAGGCSGGTQPKNILSTIIAAPILADGTLGDFERVGNMPGPRAGLGAAVLNGSLFCYGGYSDKNLAVSADCWNWRILSGGALGPLEPAATRLPKVGNLDMADGFGRCSLGYAGILILAGGEASAPNPNLSHIYTQRVTPDGQYVTKWNRSAFENPVTGGVWNNGTCAISANGRTLIFVVGGQRNPNNGMFTPKNTTNEVSVAAMDAESGVITGWARTDPLPCPKQGCIALGLDDRIMVVGGTTKDSNADRDVYIGKVDLTNGRVAWTIYKNSLPAAVTAPIAVTYRNRTGHRVVAVMGGNSTSDPTVWTSEVGP